MDSLPVAPWENHAHLFPLWAIQSGQGAAHAAHPPQNRSAGQHLHRPSQSNDIRCSPRGKHQIINQLNAIELNGGHLLVYLTSRLHFLAFRNLCYTMIIFVLSSELTGCCDYTAPYCTVQVRAVRAADRVFFRNSTSHKNDDIDESSSGGRRRERSKTEQEQEQEQEQGGGRIQGPPVWMPYDKSVLCTCCNSPFTWHSTFKGEAQEYRERYNCRHCGGLVCGPCSSKRRAIPRLGLLLPSRMCDKCFHKVR